jgi:hypothetical protein
MDFYALPDIVRWAVYFLAFIIIAKVSLFLLGTLLLIVGTLAIGISDARRSKRRKAYRAREAKAYFAERDKRRHDGRV